MKTYRVNEIFYSLQGEGIRAGTANLFLRFTGCNMRCDLETGPKSPGGFACDTEFESGRAMTGQQIVDFMKELAHQADWIIATGGEPALQLDQELVGLFHDSGYKVAIETNGSINLNDLVLDWITVSPKVAEHAIKQLKADEVKYVRGYGQGVPKTVVRADHYLISPAFEGNELDAKTLKWCTDLVKENPQWRLSVQQHKTWKVR